MRKVHIYSMTFGIAACTLLTVAAAPPAIRKALRHNDVANVEKTLPGEISRNVVAEFPAGRLLQSDPRLNVSSEEAAQAAAPTTRRAVPVKEASSLPEMYGSVCWANDWDFSYMPYGLVKIPSVSGDNLDVYIEGVDTSCGGVLVDGIYWATHWVNGSTPECIGYDFYTGAVVAKPTTSMDNVLRAGDYDPTTGKVYAVTNKVSGSGIQFATVEYGKDVIKTTKISDFNYNINSMAFDAQGNLYAILYDVEYDDSGYYCTASYLTTINKENGDVTVIGETGATPLSKSDCAIDPKTNRMFWTISGDKEYGSGLFEVDLKTGALTKLLEFPKEEDVLGLVIPEAAPEDKAPGKATDLSLNFDKGSLSGTMTFTAPKTLVDGSAASGQITYEVMNADKKVASGSVSYGETVTLKTEVTENGRYAFSVSCSNAEGKGPEAWINAFIGNGIPASPAEVTASYSAGKANLTWKPVTVSADGGYLNPADVTYTVTRYPDEVVVADNLKATSFSENIAEPEAIKTYYYGVVANFSGLTSDETQSNPFSVGSVLPPYTQSFDDANALSGFTIIDGNKDGGSWYVYGGSAAISYGQAADLDDWMITPPVKLQGGQAYKVSFKAKCYNSSYPERLEAKWGASNTAAGMVNTLVKTTDITNNTYTEFMGMIVPDKDGSYYVGIHAISDAMMYVLFVDDLEISEGMSAKAPEKVSDLTVKSGDYGESTATVSFNAPKKNLLGENINSLTKIEVMRGGEVVKTFDAPAVGAQLSFIDNLSETGDYVYTVRAYNSEGAGESISASVYVGINLPVPPAKVKVERTSTAGEVALSWTPVTEDISGSKLSESNVKYDIYTYAGGSLGEVVKENLDVPSYTYKALNGGQDFVQYAVFAKTVRGYGEGRVSDMIPVGTPYEDYDESFADCNLKYCLGVSFVPGKLSGTVWNIYNDSRLEGIASVDGDNGFLAMQGQYLDQAGRMMTGLISLSAFDNPEFSFYTYSIVSDDGQTDANTISVSVREDGAENWTEILVPTSIDTWIKKEGWLKVSVDLSAYAGKTIQIAVDSEIKLFGFTFFDNFSISSGASVETVRNDAVISTARGAITIDGAEGLDVRVAAVDGRLVHAGKGNATVNVPAGIYIVKAGKKVTKVNIR